ncbi:tRNA uridine-5-carboxymethylaminomethyl(34) synthesis GTPase MnmE [Sphingomonas sp.]|uniref:tRNA uridine-5-carboxymethylaminomethyl(34) synthesis GTPase MnmE n=1 Tax=Sphingomonas sp. TaxID=28214 RepID=UPI00178D26CA|nr:tRNA uridine-5-carboxymethylaminomethyl(34) synthesis GTPase MnmE [Sphingomonas sp.]MBA3510432.1 tRNA uridine-5-carboxymethylaminomethyl(34) synthesis GTPase MnmE [Sphingomonas sp.]
MAAATAASAASAATIYALASGRPPAAIAIIRVSGPHAHAAGQRIAGELPQAREVALRELRHPATGLLLDHALALRFEAPASSTGEDVVELHIHGGRAVADAVLDALASLDGLRLAKPGEFTRRALENGRIDLTEAEGLADLIEAETESQRRAALALAQGGLRRRIEQWQQRLLALSAQAERAIDYDEEDHSGHDPKASRDCGALATELQEWLARPRIEPLRDGVRVVIAGPPNAGKSSLLNAISGTERAIVTEIPGTTRDHIEVPLALGGIPLLLTDTAGLRASDEPVERIGVGRSEALIESADVLVWLGEAGEAPPHGRLVRVHAKCDLAERADAPPDAVPVSSLTGEGVAALLERVAELAGSLLPGEDSLALNRRQATHIAEAEAAMSRASAASDIVTAAEELRFARAAFDRLTGRAGLEDVLDALFSRFCLGK